jgi:hypothetical protein
MKYKVLLNEEQRNLLMEATLIMMEDKNFSDRIVAGTTFKQLVYGIGIKEDDGNHISM